MDRITMPIMRITAGFLIALGFMLLPAHAQEQNTQEQKAQEEITVT